MTGISVSTRDGTTIPIPNETFESIGAVDLRRLRFSGRPKSGQSFAGNFVECLFEGADLEQINFVRCDWKDCRLHESTFLECDLGSASLITNSFESCRFIKCRFSDTGITDYTFRRCTFEECDLTSVVMKTNRVEESQFVACKTSNKAIESSLLIDTRWLDMRIELGLLLGNFGITKNDLHNCIIYARRPNGHYEDLECDDFTVFETEQLLSPMERFRLAFFRTGSADGDAETFETILNPRNWTGDAIIPASFGSLLGTFSQFLLALYVRSRVPAYAVLRFHTHNFELLEWLGRDTELLSLYQIAAGVHLTLTREVDNFTSFLQGAVNANATRLIRLEAEGPLDKPFYQDLFDEIGLTGAEVRSVRPRNSPIELTVLLADYTALMACVAVVLASRTKIELTRSAEPKTSKRKTSMLAIGSPKDSRRPLITFQSGFSQDRPSEFQINISTLLPRSLLLDLHLCISVAAFKKVRGILVNLLQPDHSQKS